MDRAFIAENSAERQRLFAITGKLTAKDLARQFSNGWSVADTLVHLAFWDSYALSALREWEKSGFRASTSFNESTSSVNMINEGVRVLSQSIAANAAVSLARDAAEAADLEMERITPELIAALEAGEQPWFLNRAEHRNLHLNKIQNELGL
jgi:hypothetical protein